MEGDENCQPKVEKSLRWHKKFSPLSRTCNIGLLMSKGALRTPRKEKLITVLSWLLILPFPLLFRHLWHLLQPYCINFVWNVPLTRTRILQSYYTKPLLIHLISLALSSATAVQSLAAPVLTAFCRLSSGPSPAQITSCTFINIWCLHECKIPLFTEVGGCSSLQTQSLYWSVHPSALEFMESHWFWIGRKSHFLWTFNCVSIRR